MCFVADFIHFPAVQKFENRLRFDKVTDSSKVGTFSRHSVEFLLDICRSVQIAACDAVLFMLSVMLRYVI